MNPRFLRRAASATLTALMTFSAMPAHADGIDAQAVSGAMVHSANDTLKSTLGTRNRVAQAMPVGEPHQPVSRPSLPLGLSYTLDGSIAYPLGTVTHGNQEARLPGGFDTVVG